MMDNDERNLKWMDLLISHEEKMVEIYSLFAGFTSSYSDFWKDMVWDETRHVAWLRVLNERLKSGKLKIDAERFPREAIQLSLNYISEQIGLYKAKGISSRKAFTIAVNIETAMIERKFFDAFEGLDDEARGIIGRVINETKTHQEKVRKIQATLS